MSRPCFAPQFYELLSARWVCLRLVWRAVQTQQISSHLFYSVGTAHVRLSKSLTPPHATLCSIRQPPHLCFRNCAIRATPPTTRSGTCSPNMASVDDVMEGKQVALTSLNPHITCSLCGGYLVDATTVTECGHSCEYDVLLLTKHFQSFKPRMCHGYRSLLQSVADVCSST